MKIPKAVSYVPTSYSQFSDKMTFAQCLINVLISSIEHSVTYLLDILYQDLISEVLRRDASLLYLCQKCSLSVKV